MTTRERWNVRRYRMPHLHVRTVRRLADTVELDAQSGIYRLSCDRSGSDEAELEPILSALRDPRCSLWRAIRKGDGDVEGLVPLLFQLDHLGLIRECAVPVERATKESLSTMLNAWSSELGRDVEAHGQDAVKTLQHLVNCVSTDGSATRATVLSETNFAILTVRLQARYLRFDAPAVLGLIMQGLSAAERRARGEAGANWDGIQAMPSWAEEEWSNGLVDPSVLRRYLRSIGSLVRDAIGPGAIRRSRSSRISQQPITGINFMIELEGEVAGSLAALGPSAAFAVSQDAALAPKVVKSAFLQEYLVTCRFVECIAPLLSRRFATPLREAVHRYFAEEMGHERFERQNCLHLGLTEGEVDAAEPLPLHLAFIDIATSLAHESPVSFFCASMFTEGLIGDQDSLISLAQHAMPDDPVLLRAIGHHVAVNDEADHRGVGRDWMSHVPVVPPDVQAEVSELIAYLGELNWRMWHQLVQSCATANPTISAQRSAIDGHSVLS